MSVPLRIEPQSRARDVPHRLKDLSSSTCGAGVAPSAGAGLRRQHEAVEKVARKKLGMRQIFFM